MLTTTFLQSMSDVTADQKLFAMLKLKELWRKTKWTVETEGHGPNRLVTSCARSLSARWSSRT